MIQKLLTTGRLHYHPSLRLAVVTLVGIVRAEVPEYRTASRRDILAALATEGFPVGRGGDGRDYIAGVGLVAPQVWHVEGGRLISASMASAAAAAA